MKKYRILMLWHIAVILVCTAMHSAAARKDEITLVMVPREDAAVQLGMDIANKYPTLLVSYRLGANDIVSLHGWTGTQWVNVSTEDFLAGSFFRKGPDSTLIVESKGVEVPATLLPPPDWCASVAKITTTEMRPLLHLMGQYYDFSFKDWNWFSKRYNLDLDAINPEGLNVSWYHKRMEDHLKSSEVKGNSDLQFWVTIRQAMSTERSLEAANTESSTADEIVSDPFTNDAPSAVIMGAADTPAELLGDATPAASEEIQ